jgi:hypothetical protein
VFYVCSYGGSGSTMLGKALSKFGKVYHIHNRYPPDKLEYVNGRADTPWGGGTFNGIVIPDEELHRYCVIYIYRNPSFSILSRFKLSLHLEHIEADPTITLDQVLTTKKDLYKIREFYDNYTVPKKSRNYKIYCIKYEELFDKQNELSSLIDVDCLNLVNSSNRTHSHPILEEIYSELIEIINDNNFITIS